MLNLKDLSIKLKLILAVGIFQVLSLIIAILGTVGLSQMEKDFTRSGQLDARAQQHLARTKKWRATLQ
jgi:DNA-binding MltR family transcriptional regulator